MKALDLTLDLLKSKKTVSPAEINKHVGKGNYASKYICYLKNRGHNIATTKQGRDIVAYEYLGQDTTIGRVKRASLRGTAQPSTTNTVSKPVKKVKAEPTKKSKKDKVVAVEKTGGKPVMTKEEIKKATEAILALRMKNNKKEVEKTLVAPVAASSFTVDPDWDGSEQVTTRELGL